MRRVLLFLILSVVCISCDRVTKDFATNSLRGNEPVVIAGGVVTLEYAENQGAFLSLGEGLPHWARFWFLGIGTGVVLILIATAIFLRADMSTCARIGLTLIFAGGLGNLFDRIVTGRVVDFLFVRVGFLHTGVFNVADMAIMCGVVPLFLGGVLGRRSRSTREGKS